MESLLDGFNQRSGEDWLIGFDQQELAVRINQRREELTIGKPPAAILLAERHPLPFLAGLIAASAANCPVVLGNPDWGESEWQQVFEQVQPDRVWGVGEKRNPLVPLVKGGTQFKVPPNKDLGGSVRSTAESPLVKPHLPTSPILIPTGGSSGKIRFTLHTWETLMASVAGFRQYFQVDRVNSFCVLPLYHVSGLMQLLRSLVSGGKIAILPFRDIHHWQDFDPTEFFLSLVPTQLQRLLEPDNNLPSVSWLRQFQTVLLGGAPAWTDLLDRARQQGIRLAPTYGMTETASQVATLKPEDFLAGKTGCGQVLPHAQITVHSPMGDRLEPNQIGQLRIQATSLALGYYPILFEQSYFQPDDLGYFDVAGYLHLVGRASDKIITGGENVFPAEVEAALQATGLLRDVAVMGIPDRQWGQAVTAIYVPIDPHLSIADLQTALAGRLSKYKQPKHWIRLEQLPRNAQGKVNRQQLESLVREWRVRG